MTHEEMERTLVRWAELQMDNQQLLREALGAVNKLEDLVRRSKNGGKQES